MELTKQEKELLKYLLMNELKEFEESTEDIRPSAPFLAVEEKYDELIKKVLKKLQ